jgi:hypothetical protein
MNEKAQEIFPVCYFEMLSLCILCRTKISFYFHFKKIRFSYWFMCTLDHWFLFLICQESWLKTTKVCIFTLNFHLDPSPLAMFLAFSQSILGQSQVYPNLTKVPQRPRYTPIIGIHSQHAGPWGTGDGLCHSLGYWKWLEDKPRRKVQPCREVRQGPRNYAGLHCTFTNKVPFMHFPLKYNRCTVTLLSEHRTVQNGSEPVRPHWAILSLH